MTRSDSDVNLANLFAAKLLFDDGKIFTNRVLNILNRFDFSTTLGSAPRQAWNRNGEALFRLMNGDAIAHRSPLKQGYLTPPHLLQKSPLRSQDRKLWGGIERRRIRRIL